MTPLGTSTILPITPPLPSNSCACRAWQRGNRCAISGLIFSCCSRSNSVSRSWRNHAADTTYGNGEFLQWLADRSITPYMRTRDSIHRKRSPFFGPERFTYEPENNSYRCPAGEQLNYVGLNVRNRAHAYIGSGKRCGACSQKAQCTSGRYKYLAIHMHEPAPQRARQLANTPAVASAQRERKKVEPSSEEMKNR